MFLRLRTKITVISTFLSILILFIVFTAITMNEYQSKMDFIEATLTEQVTEAASEIEHGENGRTEGIVMSGEKSVYPFQNVNAMDSNDIPNQKNLSVVNQNENISISEKVTDITEGHAPTKLGLDSNFQSAKWIPIIIYKVDYERNTLVPVDTSDAELTQESLDRAPSTYIPMENGFWRDTDSGLCYVKKTTSEGDIIAFTDVSSVDSYIDSVLRAFSMVLVLTVVVIGVFFWITSGIIVKPLRDSWERQQRFVADASHELKTPVAVIMANCSVILSDKDTDEKSRKWTETTLAEAESMKNLISDMLFLATSSNDMAVGTQKVNMSKEAQKSAMQFEGRAFECGNTIEYSDVEKDISVNMNPMNASRVIAILIDNACKYSHHGTQIDVKVYGTKKHAVLEVSDVGETIPKENEKDIFDRFFRMDDSRTGESGYGLGLAMAKDIVEKAGGTISAHTDTQTNVTTFTVKLPRAF